MKLLLSTSNKQGGKSEKIEQIFLDPKGLHCIICTDDKSSYYFHLLDDEIKPLQATKGNSITAVSWQENSMPSSTGDMILGTKDGKLYNWQIRNEQRGEDSFKIIEDPYTELIPIKFEEVSILKLFY